MIAPGRLGIFAKEPVAGQVKTRLCPPFSPQQAARFYRVCLEETVERAVCEGFSPVLFYSGSAAWFHTHFPGLTLLPQRGDDLGARIRNAFCDLFEASRAPAALIGTDSPDLPPDLIRQAFDQLPDCDALSIPASDGGYVLIGLRKKIAALFEQIPWSTEGVLSATRKRSEMLGIDYREFSRWEDVDDVTSLAALVERSPLTRSGKAALELLRMSGPERGRVNG